MRNHRLILKVRKIEYLLVLTFICFSGQSVLAQILDDSTKQVYGPNTTSYVLEEDIQNSSGKKLIYIIMVKFTEVMRFIKTWATWVLRQLPYFISRPLRLARHLAIMDLTYMLMIRKK
jgi:hypothetical protein